MKLEGRLNLLVLPLVVLPLLLLGWTAYEILYEQSRKISFNSMTEILDSLSQELNQERARAQRNTELLASDLHLVQYALTNNEFDRSVLYQRSVLSRFHHYQKNHPRYDEIRFILPDGYEETRWAKKGIVNSTDEEADTWWFSPLVEAGNKTAFFFGENPDSGRNGLYIFKPIYLKDVATEGSGSEPILRGFLGITLNLDWFQEKMRSMGSQMESCVALLSPAGEILLINRCMSAVQQAALTALFSTKSALPPLGVIESRSLNGTDHYVGHNEVMSDYTLVTAAPATVIHLAARELSRKMLIITVAAVLVSLCVLTFFLRRVVVKPLKGLIAASNQIGSGKFGTHIPVNGEDEISELAISFNRMARDLAVSDEKIRQVAHYDNLTKLPNRHMFQTFLDKTIAHARRTKTNVALFFLDIDNFKTINDTLGHDVGDELLKAFAAIINDCLRDEDFLSETEDHSRENMLSRQGGDEFTIILPSISEPQDAAIVAQRIIDALARDIILAGQEIRISASIGITVFPMDGDDRESLLKSADIAMYHAKEQGRNNYQFYASELMENIINRIESEKELRQAIDEGQMTMHYQPQIHCMTEGLCGFESLVRWSHPVRGMIPPFDFIPLAEETGLIVEMGNWIMHESCRQAAAWRTDGGDDLKMSVNVSSVQFRERDMAQCIADTLIETGLPGRCLTIELTESILIEAEEHTLQQLRRIQELGVTIALDDFGTGYSSLSYLRTFPVDILKIDRSFIIESEREDVVRVIVTAILEMANALNIKVVAEGVEDLAQIEFLRSINCDIIQGYYYSRPLAAVAALHFSRVHEAQLRQEGSAA